MQSKYFETVTEALNELSKRGYTHEFVADDANECMVCHKKELALSPDEFTVDEFYRFEGNTDPADQTILYAISSKKHNVKGTIVNAYGIYAEESSNKLLEKLMLHSKQEDKPIKRHAALVKFSQEHHFGLLLCWKIRQGIKKNIALKRIADYVLFFYDNDLKKHFAEEEKIMFPLLPVNDALRMRAESEHKLFEELIATLRLGNANADVLAKIVNTLDAHIRFEERVLFNYVQQKLSDEALESLLKQHIHKARDIDNEWKDHFWKLN